MVNQSVKMIDEMGADEPLDWTCSECQETFETERAFKLHQKIDHGKQDPFV
jgi:hypothetical protein